MTYNANDLVHTIQQGTNPAATYTLDVDNQRIRTWTDTAGVTHTNHYNNTTDSPSWTDEGDGTSTRDISGLSGLIAVAGVGADVIWQISDIQGNIVATTSTGSGLDATSKADEYGNLQDSNQVGNDRYAWLGTKQRAADNPDGIILMGVRLYNPALGRFLSTDPVPGGSCNRYDYVCQDPSNETDLDGNCKHHWYEAFANCLHWRKAWQTAVPHFLKARRDFSHAWYVYSHDPYVRGCLKGIFGGAAGSLIKDGINGGLRGIARSVLGFAVAASSMVFAAPSGSTGVGALTEQMPESGVLLGRGSNAPGAGPYLDGSRSMTQVA